MKRFSTFLLLAAGADGLRLDSDLDLGSQPPKRPGLGPGGRPRLQRAEGGLHRVHHDEWEPRGLLTYSNDEMEALKDHDEYMMELQREIKRVLHLEKILPEEVFRAKFSPTNEENARARGHALTALGLLMTFTGSSHLVGPEDLDPHLAVKIVGWSGVALGNVRAGLAMKDKYDAYKHVMETDARELFHKAAGHPLEFWSDTSTGVLWAMYLKAREAAYAWESGTPTVTAEVVMDKGGNHEHCDALNGPTLLPGQIITLDGRHNLDNDENECVKVKGSGWIHRGAVNSHGWYKSKKKMDIFADSACSHKIEDVHIAKKDVFAVVLRAMDGPRRQVYMKLGDGRGFACYPGAEASKWIQGPLTPDYASFPEHGETHLSNHRAVLAAARAQGTYSSAPSLIGRTLLKGGIFVGSLATGGALAIPGLVIGLLDMAVTNTMNEAKRFTLRERAAYLMVALANWEANVFKDGSRRNCDRTQPNPCGTADERYHCMATGVFTNKGDGNNRKSHGKCVRVLRPRLADRTPCFVAADCESGYCAYNSPSSAKDEDMERDNWGLGELFNVFSQEGPTAGAGAAAASEDVHSGAPVSEDISEDQYIADMMGYCTPFHQ